MKIDETIALARDRFKLCQSAVSAKRDLAVEDLKFEQGEQWPDDLKRLRERENRACLTINRIPAYVRQVVNEIRQSRPSIKVRAVDSVADPETAEILNGMIRAIEQDSSAESAYDWAAEYAVKCGEGYWRVLTEWDDDGIDQVIKIKRVRNPFSVYIDPNAEEQDVSDMRFAFIVQSMPRSEFESKYPKASGEWESDGQRDQWWYTENTVRIAEYWEKTDEGVTQRLMTGNEVLEETQWLGKYIPIIRVVGREVDIEGDVTLKGMVRDLKDPQRQYNYIRSAETDRYGLTTLAPWIGPKNAFRDPKWKTANKRNHPYIEYDGNIAPSKTPPPDVSPAFAQEVQLASEELKALTGIYDAGLGARSNEISGVAIDSRRSEGDVSNFDFIDNLARAMTYCGKVLVDLIPKIYSGERMVRILRPDGSDELVQINAPYVDPKTMKGRDYNIGAGRYDVAVGIGPGYATQRKEAAASMLDVLKAFPDTMRLIGDLYAKNLDWPDADEIAKRLKTLVPPEVLQSENPQLMAIMRQKDGQLQQMQQQLQAAIAEVQRLTVQLQGKQQENQIKAAEVERKIKADLMKHIEGMTGLELEAGRDISEAGKAYQGGNDAAAVWVE